VADIKLEEAEVIQTFRVLLAACVKKQGLLNKLVLSRADLERAGEGKLKVEQRPDGSIKLSIEKSPPKLLVN